MAIPGKYEITLPLLRYAEKSGPFRNSDAVGPLADEFKLTLEERAKFAGKKRKVREFDNRIHWASGQLGMAVLLKKKEPKRENDPYYITDRGREVLADPPALLDYEYLKRFPEYVAACKNNGSSKTPRDRSKRNGAHDTGARRDPIAEVTNDLKGSTVHTAELTLTSEDSQQTEPSEDKMGAASYSYTIKHIIEEGCFLDQERLREIFKRLKVKKNLILQGPPGTGKTWLAKRLAYALIGSKDQNVTQDRLRMVQFHQSLSYEDF